MTTVLCYVSAHGFGHSARTVEVLNALAERRPDLRVALRTESPRWFFDFNLRPPFSHAPVRLDVGAIQRDSLSIDIAATLRAGAQMMRDKRALVEREVAATSPLRPRLVFADIPALAFEVAHALDVPGVGMANFSWDWIYADYVRDAPEYGWLVDDIRRSYARATLLLRLPLHGDLGAFPRVRDIAFVTRRGRATRPDVRQRLGLPAQQRLVLLSYGGLGVELPTAPTAPPDVRFVTNHTPGSSAPPAWCRGISTEALIDAALRYEDLVGAVDAVMTKPGYGIVAECIANSTPIVYTPRGRFAEYPCLTAGIAAYLPYAVISNDDLYAGRWKGPLADVLARQRPRCDVNVDGAAVAAETLCTFMDDAS